jgi:hypothetical protein
MTDYQGNPKGFVDEVITPALAALGLDGYLQAATELLLGTAMQESGLVFRKQLGGGPARGLFQMEPATHDDIWANFLKFRAALAAKIRQFLAGREVDAEELIDNDRYAAAMARIQYYRMGQIVGKDPVPDATDIAGMADYWKTYYNTAGGAGAPAQFVANWEAHHGPIA